MTNGYVTAPQCVPSRGGLLTGRYQNRFGLESNKESLKGFNAEITIADRLKKVGYATGMVGKWHLGPSRGIIKHGFDDVFYQDGNWTNFDFQGNDVEPGTKVKGVYHLEANNRAATAFIQRHHKKPFFLYVAHRAPHVPLNVPQKYLDRFPGKMPLRRKKALAMISVIDDGVGMILKSLRKYDIERNTLIFVIGDNGAPLKIHKLDAPGNGPGWDGSLNTPLNGEKGMLSEGGIRVPFVAYWKGKISPNQVYEHPVISLDVAATAASLAQLPKDDKLDGMNLMPYLARAIKGPPERTLYWRWIAQSAVREGKWKYLRGGSREYLYDLSKDKEEKHNLLKEQPEIAKRLQKKLQTWAKELTPAGLETKSMAQTWEQYFDYYLEGKPAPKIRAKTETIKGWLARGGKLQLKAGALEITPLSEKRAFIVKSNLNLTGPITAVVRLSSEQGGKAGIAWRQSGQRDFPKDQVVYFEGVVSKTMQEHKVKIPTTGKVIHVRLLLPKGRVTVERIEFQNETGKTVQSWHFGNN